MAEKCLDLETRICSQVAPMGSGRFRVADAGPVGTLVTCLPPTTSSLIISRGHTGFSGAGPRAGGRAGFQVLMSGSSKAGKDAGQTLPHASHAAWNETAVHKRAPVFRSRIQG